MKKNEHEGKYAFFSHKECEYFPCHDTDDTDNFNCIFCYCPLYPLVQCGGNYVYTESGCKDCSCCMLPHRRENYGYVISRLEKSRGLPSKEKTPGLLAPKDK